MKIKQIKSIILLVLGILIAGCASHGIMRDADDATNNTQTNLHQLKKADAMTAPAVLTKHGYYYDSKPIADDDRALWLHNQINISAKQVPLAFIMTRILRNSNVLVKYQPSVHKDRLVSINYTGTVKGALEQLASQTNYAYEASEHEITWESFITKTFDISFMPGAATYLVGQTSANTYGSSSSSSNSTSANSTNTSGNLLSNDQEYSGLQAASLSVWSDLKKTLEELKSEEGKIAVSEATTMVTVYDHPSNMDAIAHYINQLNKSMSQEVRLKVQVLEVELDKEHTFGIDWNLMQKSWLGAAVGINGGIASGANVAGAAASQSVSGAFSPLALQLGDDGNNLIIKSLSTQGKVSVVTEPTVVTMNNQVAEIRISRDTSYLQNVSVTSGNGNNDNTTTALTPGVVTDGFILYLLPKIKGDQVYLQISSTLSNLASLNTVSSSGKVNVDSTGKSKTDGKTAENAIQIPTLTEKRFNIRGLVANNSTLIVGGFKQTHNETRETKMMEIKALGGQGAQVKNSETIILITPTVVEN